MLQSETIRDTTIRPSHEIRGRVRIGNRLGRTIGFPTANIPMEEDSTLAHGIYVSLISVNGGQRLGSVSYVGRRPTVGGTTLLLETHIFDFGETIYGVPVIVELFQQLRADAFFDDLDSLTQQIAKDCLAARRCLAAITEMRVRDAPWSPRASRALVANTYGAESAQPSTA